jgi:colanic acid biosynthesis glycosyl transferase WcaI
MPSKITSIVAAGGAVLVTASPDTSLHQQINSHRFGWTIQPDNPEVLAQEIIYLYNQPSLIKEAKANALIYADQYVRKDRVIHHFLSELFTADIREKNTILQTN